MKVRITFVIVVCLQFSYIYAFDAKAHKLIEQHAYCLLNREPNGDEVIDYLLKNRFLFADYSLPHSAFPDLSLDRQFAQDRQMFHFMAANKDVMEACKESQPDKQQHILLVQALKPNLKMMYYLIREFLNCPKGASQAARGLYVVMHIIADSYSSEHTKRSENMEIVTIKGWQLARVSWPDDAKVDDNGDGTLRLLHHAKEKLALGDRNWRKGNRAWNEYPTDSLSELATQAAIAIKDTFSLSIPQPKTLW